MNKVEFRELPISPSYGRKIRRIFYVVVNGKSKMKREFNNLDEDMQNSIKVLISMIATKRHYESDKIKWNLHKYNFGEIRPFPQRFFFFQKCGNNLIFFDYYLNKKRDKLNDEIYLRIKKRKEEYEKKFEKFISRI